MIVYEVALAALGLLLFAWVVEKLSIGMAFINLMERMWR